MIITFQETLTINAIKESSDKMYLKKIIANGFKSFADKTTIEFINGINGIVGPNGSGKSNVVDAVRWVLGEQSVKQLRGDGNMTDVIFSGSKSRNNSNSASICLIFDNTDNYFPLAFTEVSIKRRVYLDGTNEYYLNDEKCRLKDITDLLLDSGIAKESFNIISQGKIEEIISSKPSERRTIIEEAAGVLKYKRRKEDAIRKLDKTHNNMDRVNDIIHELEVQVEPLKEQRDSALKYQDAKEELDKIELALIVKDITDLNYEYQQNKARIEVLSEEILGMGSSSTTGEAKLESLKLSLAKLELELKENNKNLIEYSTKVEKINSEKQIILERQKYDTPNEKLHNRIVELSESQYKVKNDLENYQNKFIEFTNRLKTVVDEINNLEKQINDIKTSKTVTSSKLSDLIRKESFTNNKIETLKNSIENNELLPFSVRSVLSNPKLTGIHGTIGNLIEVEEKYSTAVSVALGASVSNIIVDNEKSAKEAIEYLKNNKMGRATFFPINLIKPKKIDTMVQSVLNSNHLEYSILSSKVKAESKYQNIIDNQLGNIILVDDINTANTVAKLINHSYRIVTLEGELLHVGGSLTGGSINTNKSVISEKYELENMIRSLEEIHENIKLTEEKINEYDYNLKSLEDKFYLETREKIEISETLNNYNLEMSTLKEKLDQIESEIKGLEAAKNGSLSEEEQRIMEEYYSAVKERDKYILNASSLQNKEDELKNSIEQLDFSLRKENSLYNAKNKELKELEISVNRADVKLDNLLNTLREDYGMTYEKAESLHKLELEESIARSKVNQLKRIIRELGMVNLAAIEEYERVSSRYEFLIKQRDDLVSAENTLLEIITEMDSVMERDFKNTFEVVNKHFTETFKDLFKGGTASLKLTDPNNLLETGIEIIASPPGKKLTSISLLSGGEKTFTAISLLFAILKSRTIPFCILDEVEAALDEANVDSFGAYLKKLQDKTQFILITHKKRTMEYADVLYGITMQESGVSKLVSVKLEDIHK